LESFLTGSLGLFRAQALLDELIAGSAKQFSIMVASIRT
jgi:hypothetical protein